MKEGAHEPPGARFHARGIAAQGTQQQGFGLVVSGVRDPDLVVGSEKRGVAGLAGGGFEVVAGIDAHGHDLGGDAERAGLLGCMLSDVRGARLQPVVDNNRARRLLFRGRGGDEGERVRPAGESDGDFGVGVVGAYGASASEEVRRGAGPERLRCHG